jgi:replicative superfamily II helicase
MSFKQIRRPTISLESPESMYKDIHPRKIEGLLSHQADVLRQYEKDAVDKRDVALQMPTGSGKTLVGGIIAEWRRRKLGERVVYICPTRQLVHQVARYMTQDYGIRTHAMTGSQKDYKPASKA